MSRRPAPRYMGGQAVVDGVMMRGSSTWAVAVRKPDGDIGVVVHDAANWSEKWSHWPLARGIATLAESLSLGFKALTWSAEQQLPEEDREKMGKGTTAATIGVAVLLFAGLFLVLPALAARGLNNSLSIGAASGCTWSRA